MRFLMIWVVAVFLIPFLSLFVGGTTQQGEVLRRLMDFHVAKHFYPRTLRIMEFSKVPFQITEEDMGMGTVYPPFVPRIMGTDRPLVPSGDPRSMLTGGMRGLNEVFRYVTVVVIGEDIDSYEQAVNYIEKTVSRRYERLIIVTHNQSTMKKMMTIKKILDHPHKSFFSLDQSGIVWSDPIIFDGPNLVPVPVNTQLEHNIPVKKRLGGNLRGRHFFGAGTEYFPWMYLTGDPKNPYAGSQVRTVAEGARYFNYTVEWNFQENYGQYFENNGSWTGMAGDVAIQKRDFTMVLAPDYTWYWALDFTTTVSWTPFIYMRNRPRTELKWYGFMLPFSPELWIWVIVSFIIIGIVQMIVMYYQHDKTMKYIVWDSGSFLPYAMAMEQGLQDIPKGARYLSLIILMGCTVLGTGYKAKLRDNLSYPKPEHMPTTQEELLERKDFKLWLYTAGGLEKANLANNPILGQVEDVSDLETCVRNAFMNHYSACLGFRVALYHSMAKSLTINTRAEALVIGAQDNPYFIIILGMAFQKDSPFVDSYSAITEGIWDSGIGIHMEKDVAYQLKLGGIQRLEKERKEDPTIYEKLKQGLFEDDQEKPLAWQNLWATFCILPIGFVMGTGFFTLEKWYWRRYLQRELEEKNGKGQGDVINEDRFVELDDGLAMSRLGQGVISSDCTTKGDPRNKEPPPLYPQDSLIGLPISCTSGSGSPLNLPGYSGDALLI